MLRSELEAATTSNLLNNGRSRRLIFTILHQLSDVGLTLSEQGGDTHFFGDKQASLQASLTVSNPNFYKRLLTDGSIGAGEAYIDGWWDSPNLTNVVRILARNLVTLDKIEAKVGWITRLAKQLRHFSRRNNLTNAKDNISAHYDLGNDLYRHFLDDKMLYSAGVYLSDSDTLAQAQINKMARLCDQLQLTEHDHLLEIV